MCYVNLYEQAHSYVWEAPSSEIYFRLSEKHLFFNFLNILEIMLNEVRKRDIAIGIFEYATLNNADKMKSADPMLLRHITETD